MKVQVLKKNQIIKLTENKLLVLSRNAASKFELILVLTQV